jgi:hypothetical protein
LGSFLGNCFLLSFSDIFVGGRGELNVENSFSDGDEVVSGVVVMCACFGGCVRVSDLTKFFDAFRCVGDFLSFSDHLEAFDCNPTNFTSVFILWAVFVALFYFRVISLFCVVLLEIGAMFFQ